jgi:hypothetical protein
MLHLSSGGLAVAGRHQSTGGGAAANAPAAAAAASRRLTGPGACGAPCTAAALHHAPRWLAWPQNQQPCMQAHLRRRVEVVAAAAGARKLAAAEPGACRAGQAARLRACSTAASCRPCHSVGGRSAMIGRQWHHWSAPPRCSRRYDPLGCSAARRRAAPPTQGSSAARAAQSMARQGAATPVRASSHHIHNTHAVLKIAGGKEDHKIFDEVVISVKWVAGGAPTAPAGPHRDAAGGSDARGGGRRRQRSTGQRPGTHLAQHASLVPRVRLSTLQIRGRRPWGDR